MKKHAKIILNKKGQASLLITLVVMSILLYTVLFVINMNIKEIRVVKNTEKSIKAFYIADSGMEKVLYDIKNGNIDLSTLNIGDDLYSSGSVDIDGLGSFNAVLVAPLTVKVTSIYKDTSRAIEASW